MKFPVGMHCMSSRALLDFIRKAIWGNKDVGALRKRQAPSEPKWIDVYLLKLWLERKGSTRACKASPFQSTKQTLFLILHKTTMLYTFFLLFSFLVKGILHPRQASNSWFSLSMPLVLVQCRSDQGDSNLHLQVFRNLNCLLFNELQCYNYPVTVTLRYGSQKICPPPNTINSRYTPPCYNEAKHHYFSVISRMNCL